MRLFFFIPVLLIAGALHAQDPFADRGNINWVERVIIAKGIGAPNPSMPPVTARPMAIQAARSAALRNAMEMISGIRLSSSTTAAALFSHDESTKTRVQGFIASFKESEPRYMSDKTVEITVSIPIDRQLAEILLPPEITAAPRASAVPPSHTPVPIATGWVIDGRGFSISPALAPRLVDEKGKEIYGPSFVLREAALRWGGAGYAKTPAQAFDNKERIGSEPRLIKALGGVPGAPSDLVIPDDEARMIEAAEQKEPLLTEGAVIILID